MNISPEFTVFVALCSGLLAIGNFIKMARTPFDKIKQQAGDIDELKKRAEKQAEIDKAMLNALQAIVNNMIDGNGVEGLKNSRTELQKAVNDIAIK